MTIGAIKCESEKRRVDPSSARLCNGHCVYVVTTEKKCPACGVPTTPHPEAKEKQHYCVECAAGPFPVADLHLITWNEDPYIQTDDGDLICFCGKCHAAKIAVEEAS